MTASANRIPGPGLRCGSSGVVFSMMTGSIHDGLDDGAAATPQAEALADAKSAGKKKAGRGLWWYRFLVWAQRNCEDRPSGKFGQ